MPNRILTGKVFSIIVFAILLATVPLMCGAELGIDGTYAVEPTTASESGYKSISLVGALIKDRRPEDSDIYRQTRYLRIAAAGNKLQLSLLDSDRKMLKEVELNADRNEVNGIVSYFVSRVWSLPGSGETRTSGGISVTRLQRNSAADLLLSEKSRSGEKEVQFWLIYPHLQR